MTVVNRLGLLHLNRLGATNTVVACAIIWLAISLQNAIAQQPAVTTRTVEASSSETSLPTFSSPADVQYRIGPGDVLDIRVFNYPQLSRDAARVDGRGMIRMPLLDGDIQAGCRTENELANDLAARYLKYQRRPHVDVFIKEYNSQPVAVIGAVSRPGRFQLQRRVRLLELISFAGGPTDQAGTQIEVAHTGSVFSCNKSEIVLTAEPAAEDVAATAPADGAMPEAEAVPIVPEAAAASEPEPTAPEPEAAPSADAGSEPSAEAVAEAAPAAPAEPEMIEVWRIAFNRPRREPRKAREKRPAPRPRDAAPVSDEPAGREPRRLRAPGPKLGRRHRQGDTDRADVTQRHERPRERPVDPDSPFAKLAALKQELEKSRRE